MSPCVSRCVILIVLSVVAAHPLAAQGRPPATQDTSVIRQRLQQQLGQGVSQAELLERLRQSGMTRAQVQDQLRRAGYDPGLADQYFDVLERGGEPGRGVADDEFVRALQSIGIIIPGVEPLPSDSLGPTALDTLAARDTMSVEAEGETVFGLRFFQRDFPQSDVAFGPVDRDYRLGPGDELYLVLTGDVELAYRLDVTREGFVIIPDVGQVSVNGLTLAMLEDRLYDRLGRVYSGVRRDGNATTHFQVSLGRLRSNQVFVVGDVAFPGAKQISSASRVLHALYAAGGPTERGSFRRIEVRRGAELVGTFDMYDYLLRGDASNDIRLEHGDRVLVPPAGPQVRIQGAVRRPAIYEVRPGVEGLADVLAFAGGLLPDAIVRRIQIDRILPPDQRTSGVYRTVRDADLNALAAGEFIPVHDGDVVHVLSVPDIVRERVWITGAVNNPGIFEWTPGMTLSQLIGSADGLADPAYRPRLQIFRIDPATGERSMLQAAAPGDGIVDPTLADGDSVVVRSREELANPSFVSIDGFVKTPGEYPYAAGMTLKDLVLLAGGYIPGANVRSAEISRLTNPFERTDTTAHLLRVQLISEADTTDLGYLGAGEWPPNSQDVVLQRGDRVIIRRAPGYEPLGQVVVTGEVLYPGAYVLSTRQERVVDVLHRAGWLTDEAYPGGVRVTRRGTIVAADIERALEDPTHRANIRLEPGDTVHVSAFDPTVAVTGAVTFASRVLYRPGADLRYYLDQAGGMTDLADDDRITVTYPNGQRARIREVLWVDRVPEILPGSTIFVPEKPENERGGFNLDQFLTRTLTILSTVVTLIVAANQL